MKFINCSLLALLSLLHTLPVQQAGAQVLVNGGFETPQLGVGASLSLAQGSALLPGWTVGGTGGPVYLMTNGDVGTFQAYEGGQWIQFNAYDAAAGSTLSQTFVTTNGQSYGVAFALGSAGSGNVSMEVLVLGPGGSIMASNSYSPPANSWQVFNLNFTAISTNATLKFVDTSAQTVAVDLTLDDVVVGPDVPPVITLSPVSQTVLDGSLVTFTAAASNAPVTVQWYFGSTAIAGATSTTLKVTASTATAGSYSAEFLNGGGITNTAAAILTVVEPGLTDGGFESPKLGSGTTLSLVQGSTLLPGWVVGGTGGAVYLMTNGDVGTFKAYEGGQWLQFNAYNTADGSTLSQTLVTTNGQSYGVFFALGSAGSGNVSMQVLVLGPDGSIMASNSYTPPANGWQVFDFNYVADSTNATLKFIDTSAQTAAVDLTLDDVVMLAATPPVITLSPVSQTVLDDALVTFTAAASNAPTSMQWYLGSTAIAGATNTTLTVTASPATAGSYTARFVNNGGSVNTTAAVLTVVEPTFINGGFEIPQLGAGTSQSLVQGSGLLPGWVVGGTGGPVYLMTGGDVGTFEAYQGGQWIQFNAYNTAAGSTLSQTFVTANGHPYGVSFALGKTGTGNVSMEVLILGPDGSVMASNSYSPPANSWNDFELNFTALSTNATLEFIDTSAQTYAVDLTLDGVVVVDTSVLPPVITLSPVSQTVLDGSLVTFTAAASNAPTSVQWYLGSTAIAGATNATLTVTASTPTAGSYTAQFANSGGSTNTAAAVLAVVEPTFTNGGFETPQLANGATLSLVQGSTLLPGWVVGGTGGPVYLMTNGDVGTFTAYQGGQWVQFNANNTAAGSTLSQIFVTTNGQSYGVAFALGESGSGSESMEVLVLGPDGSVMASNSYTPSANSWKMFGFNFTALSTNATLKFIDTSAQTVSVDLTLDDVVVGSVLPPVITLSPVGQTVLDGTSVTFTAAANNAPTSVQWYFGSTAIAGATNTTLMVTASTATAGSYSVEFANSGGSTNTPAAVLRVVEPAFTNGGFEIPQLGSGASLSLAQGSTLLPGWTVGGTGGPIYLFTSGNSGTFQPYQGAQWLQFNAYNTAPGSTLSQTFVTTNGQPYGVFFALGSAGSGNVSMEVLVLGPDGSIMASNSYSPPVNSWKVFIFNFTAITTNATLEFIDTSAQTGSVDLTLDDVMVEAGTPPVVTLSPVSQTALDGSLVTFTAAANNAPTSVQWYLGSTAIAGATNATLMVTASSATAGSYTAQFINSGGSTNTAAAVLTVVEPAFTNGSFEIPQLGSGASLSLAQGSALLPGWIVGGTGGAVYLFTSGDSGTFQPYQGAQWLQFNAYNTAAGSTLSQTFVTTNGHPYGVSFALGEAGSGNVSMEVLALGPDGSVMASNSYTPSANSWTVFDLNFTALSTNATLEFIDTSAQTESVDLTLDDVVVVDLDVLPPVITLSPVSQTVLDGSLVTFTAAANNAPTSVQWYFGSTAIAGATNTTLMVTASTVTAGSYSIDFANSGGSTNTAAAVLTVVEPGFTNGGFEIPQLGSGASLSLAQGSTLLPGWTVDGTGGPIYLFTSGNSGTFQPYQGAQWLQFNAYNTAPGSTLSQTFVTTNGQPYGVSFALGEAGSGNVSMEVLVLGLDGSVIASNSYTPSANSWKVFDLNFTAVSTNVTLKFIDTSAQTGSVDLTLDDVMVEAGLPPVVTLSPVSQAVLDGSLVMFTAAASNAPTSVQWYFGSTPILGATNSTLMVTASSATAGSYTAQFINSGGSADTTAAVLTVVEPAFTNGGFEIPQLGSGAALSLVQGSALLPGWTVGGTGGAVYLFTSGDSGTFQPYQGAQWLQFNAYNTAPGATLSQTFVTTNSHPYEVSFALGQAGSGNVSMEVLALGPDGSVMASNSYTPSANSWKVFNLNFTALSTNATLEFIDTSAQTVAVDLTLDDVVVVDLDVLPPVITLSPVSQTVLDGTPVTFTAAASNGSTSVQWYLGSTAITGATNATLMVTASSATAGSYTAEFANSGGSTNTAAAVLTVVEPTLTNGGFEIPQLTNSAGQSLVPASTWLTGWTVGGTGGPIYLFTSGDAGTFKPYQGTQWLQFNAYNTPAGATLSQTFVTTNGQPYGVSFALGETGSGNVSMEVLVLGPDGSIMASNSYTPSANSWTVFELDFTAASTNATLEFIDTSSQTVSVDLTLDDVVLLDTDILPPVITLSPVSQTVLDGTPVTFTAAASNAPTSVQWYFGSTAIAGATNATLTVTAGSVTAGSYSAEFINGGGSANTAAAVLTVVEPALTNGGFEIPQLGSRATLSLVAGSTLLPGWTVGGTGGPAYLFTSGDAGTFKPYEGAQWIQFSSGNSAAGAALSQIIATTSGQSYGVFCAVGETGSGFPFERTLPGSASIAVLALGPDGTIMASNRYTPPTNAWKIFELSFTALSTNATLKFINTSTQTLGVDLTLDDVVVVNTTLNPPPVITLSPVSQIVLDGTPVTFTAAASNAPVSVQWYLGSTAIAGATNATLMVTASSATAGSYTAEFVNVGGSVSTTAAVLTVVEPALINGGFETPQLGSGATLSLVQGSTLLPGWVVGGTGGAVYLMTNGDVGTFTAYEGGQWIEFNAYNTAAGSTLSQTIVTTNSQSYGVSFALGEAGSGNMSMEVLVLGPDGSIMASNSYTPSANSWTAFEFNFTAISTNATLKFIDTSAQTYAVDLTLDDVVVAPTVTNPPPISGQFHNSAPAARSSVAVIGGQATIQLVGLPGTLYNIEASSDLINWVLIGSATADSNGLIHFLDTNAGLYRQRYYHTSIP